MQTRRSLTAADTTLLPSLPIAQGSPQHSGGFAPSQRATCWDTSTKQFAKRIGAYSETLVGFARAKGHQTREHSTTFQPGQRFPCVRGKLPLPPNLGVPYYSVQWQQHGWFSLGTERHNQAPKCQQEAPLGLAALPLPQFVAKRLPGLSQPHPFPNKGASRTCRAAPHLRSGSPLLLDKAGKARIRCPLTAHRAFLPKPQCARQEPKPPGLQAQWLARLQKSTRTR